MLIYHDREKMLGDPDISINDMAVGVYAAVAGICAVPVR